MAANPRFLKELRQFHLLGTMVLRSPGKVLLREILIVS